MERQEFDSPGRECPEMGSSGHGKDVKETVQQEISPKITTVIVTLGDIIISRQEWK